MSPVTKVVENDGKDKGSVAGVLANRDSSSDLICSGRALEHLQQSWLFMYEWIFVHEGYTFCIRILACLILALSCSIKWGTVLMFQNFLSLNMTDNIIVITLLVVILCVHR